MSGWTVVPDQGQPTAVPGGAAAPAGWTPVQEPPPPPPAGSDLDAQLHQAYDQRPLWRKVLGLEPQNLSPELQQHLATQKQNAGKQIADQLRGAYSGYGQGVAAGVGTIPFMALGPVGGMVGEAVGGGGLGLAANVATQGLGSAAVAKAEGASTPAAVGAGVLGAAGPLVEAAAPAMAETALGTRRLERAYGKTPGQAAIAETSGISPATVSQSATQQIANLNDQLTNAARAAPGKGTVQPAVDVVDSAINTARLRNNSAALEPLGQLRRQLTEDTTTLIGRPLPVARSAEDILNAKRGIGELIKTWNPEVRTAYTGIKRQIYRALDNELDQLVPESQSLNQRISSLIPVEKAGARQDLAPGILQRSVGRFAAHTGALIGGLEGARSGYASGGIPGAIAGGTVGVVAPEVLASPEFRMFMARSMANPALRELVTRGGPAALMQLFQQQQQSGNTQP